MDFEGKTVACWKCGHTNAPGIESCAKCGIGLELPTMMGAPASATAGPAKVRFSSDESSSIGSGTVLAERYEVLDTLGVGGMGSVYKVFDKRLTRVVALKTIHPQLAATPMMMKRFKQEVLLAQKITHKNVVRIFDIGEDRGTAFITMDFIEGTSLKDVIQQRGKFTPVDAVSMIREIARALEAAHGEGVVHRDLKPQNIMIEDDQHVVVMDFGIAGSAESSGATQTGSLLGTPDYMSPEQARMEEVDARSDIFSLGLIFYEMLTGKMAFSGKTVVETMFIRTKERAIPPVEIERSIPAGANDIVVKCLEPEREKRYQSVTEMLEDLENFDPSRKVGAGVLLKSRLKKATRYRNWAAAAALIMALGIGGFALRDRLRPTLPSVHQNVSVFIADFANHTGDKDFDNALEPVIKLDLEQAGFISAFDRRQAKSLGAKPPEGRLDETAAQKIATEQGLGFVVSGSLEQKGSAYEISITTTEAIKGETKYKKTVTAPNKKEVLHYATQLAAEVRVALGDNPSDSSLRFAKETLSAISLESVREYATAMEALSNAKYNDAFDHFSSATDLDPKFGLAYAGMAVAKRNLHEQQEAEKYVTQAREKIDSMTDREKWRTRAYYFNVFGNWEKCVEEYGNLTQRFPADVGAHNNLAKCLTQVRNMKQAIEVQKKAVQILPNRPLYRNNLALYSSYGSDFKAGEDEARKVQEKDPTYDTGFMALAFAQLGRGDSAAALKTYQNLEKIKPSRAKLGEADVALYDGRYNDAAGILTQGAKDDIAAGDKESAGTKLVALAYARQLQGKTQLSIEAAKEALAQNSLPNIRFLAGLIFAGQGQDGLAKEMVKILEAQSQSEPRGQAKIIEGEIALHAGNANAAKDLFISAKALLDTWITHFELGRAYIEAGSFTEADSEFDICLQRRGEALALFLDETPTYGRFPFVYYYMGRAREGQKTSGFAESYRNYLAIRENAGEDLLLADVRKRVK